MLMRAAAALVAAALTGSVGWLPPGRGAAHPKVASGAAGPGGPVPEGPVAVRHRIRYGETLSEIALRYGVSIRAIAEANGIRNPDRIVAGRVLVIPGEPAPARPAKASPELPPAPGKATAGPVQPASQPRTSDRTPQGAGPVAAGTREPSGERPAAPGRPSFPAGLADLVFEGPGGIRVQVYGTLAPPAVPVPALPGAGGARGVMGPGLLPPGVLPTAPPAPRPAPAGAPDEPLFSLRLPPAEKLVALTFNGLPDATSLPALVRALDSTGARATFFVTGAAARGGGSVILELLARGHEVGIQGLEAEDLTALPAEEVAASLDAARRALLEAGAPPPRFFRPPLGRFDARVLGAARRLGLETVLWSSIGLRDLNDPEPALLVEQARAAAFPGAILMLHADRPATAAALPAVLGALGQDGYRVVSLSELLARASEVGGSVR
ncbi:polysaccharide deacetylase family protein [Caldinitratiruptor microaerophilus]|uniref:polysaccharide deacetylase family protein n=1 Tax=Caldinitratiruptor microaerophilus TaxID=671077 RepID=UPI00222E9B13|nr:polysaccharide deacetylase family protein [Caldinitratiruptor microaerophilus]